VEKLETHIELLKTIFKTFSTIGIAIFITGAISVYKLVLEP